MRTHSHQPRPAQLKSPPSLGHVQIKIDFKAECLAGEMVEVMGQQEGTNGTHAGSNGTVTGPSYTHLIRCCDEEGYRELTRASTMWKNLD